MTKPLPPYQRVMRRVDLDPSGCRLWTGGTNQAGYGQVELPRRPDGTRRTKVVHIVVWEHERGPVPEGYDVHHECHRRNCVNVNHLELREKAEHGRHHMPRSVACTRCGATDWYDYPNGHRSCRACRRDRRREKRVP